MTQHLVDHVPLVFNTKKGPGDDIVWTQDLPDGLHVDWRECSRDDYLKLLRKSRSWGELQFLHHEDGTAYIRKFPSTEPHISGNPWFVIIEQWGQDNAVTYFLSDTIDNLRQAVRVAYSLIPTT